MRSLEATMSPVLERRGDGGGAIEVERLLSPRDGAEYEYDELLTKIGTGPYHWGLLGLCGWANAADAMEIVVVSFILPATQQELQLIDTQKGALTSVIFVGMMVGGWLWGAYADLRGRRQCLLWAMGVNASFGFLSGFASSFGWLLFFRFFSGLGVGGSIPVVFSYFCEFLPPAHRGQWMAYLAAFWMAGSISCAAIAWLVIPAESIFGLSSWRLFLFIGAAPSALNTAAMLVAPESPRWLLQAGRATEGLAILDRMHRRNNGGVSLGDLDRVSVRPPEGEAKKEAAPKTLLGLLQHSLGRTRELFAPPHRPTTLRLVAVWVALCYGYYGLTMWLPEYFSSLGQVNVYLSSFLVSLANLPGNIVSAMLVDTVGRTRMLALSMGVAGLSVVAIPLVSSEWGVVAVSCLFSGAAIPGWNALDIVSTELFPTHLRTTGFGVLTLAGRIAAILANNTFGLFVAGHPSIPLTLTALMLLTGAAVTLTLPDLKGAALH